MTYKKRIRDENKTLYDDLMMLPHDAIEDDSSIFGLWAFHQLKSGLKPICDLEHQNIVRHHLCSLLSINEQNVEENILKLTRTHPAFF